jgi:hypothetical protein
MPRSDLKKKISLDQSREALRAAGVVDVAAARQPAEMRENQVGMDRPAVAG